MFSLKGKQFRQNEGSSGNKYSVEEDNCEESPEEELSSCDEDNLSTRSNNNAVITATPLAVGKEVVPGILVS